VSLFLKIFLWFWVATAALALSVILVARATQDDPFGATRRAFQAGEFTSNSTAAVQAYKHGGQSGLDNFLRDWQHSSHIRVWLFDPKGNALGFGRVPPEMRDMVTMATQQAGKGDSDTIFQPFSHVAAVRPVMEPDGTYVTVGTMWHDFGHHPGPDHPNALMIVTFVLVAGLVCFALAKYLAAPVSRVRLAAQRLAAGDLSARAGAGKRAPAGDELSALTHDFDKMADRLENLVTAQTRLLSDVSHELRSPLARLNLSLELARRGDAQKQTAALERIERESARLEVLIGELLTLSRLEAGIDMSRTEQQIDLVDLTGEVAADADFEAQGVGSRVEFHSEVESAIISGDAELLHRAIENVTRNAVRHTAPETTVALDLIRLEENWVIRVTDRGPGVPDEELRSIFRPFYRVDTARERKQNEVGTGLGLAIAERAARAHGGSIGARNMESGGLEVDIVLPQVKPE